jgi:DNA-binding NarL/FixJ family response regulator
MVGEHNNGYRPTWWEPHAIRRGPGVAPEAQHRVVILYKHALLGEGIATYLRAKIGVEATVASACDREAVTSALAPGPAVVIFESSDPFQQFDLATLAPHAVLIDVSTVVTRGSVLSPGVAGLEQILQAVRDSSTVADPVQTHPVLSSLYRKSTVRRMGSGQ